MIYCINLEFPIKVIFMMNQLFYNLIGLILCLITMFDKNDSDNDTNKLDIFFNWNFNIFR